MRNTLAIAALILALAPASAAVERPARDVPGSPALYVFTDRDGLPQNVVLSAAEDRKGYLWVGTEEGAAFYNGRTWKVVQIPTEKGSRTVTAILNSSDGAMWFGTRSGLFRLSDEKWTTFDFEGSAAFAQPDSRPFPSEQRAGTIIYTLLEVPSDNGASEIWVGTSGGIARYDGAAWTAFTSKDSELFAGRVLCLLADRPPDRGVWAGTTLGAARYENGRWTVVYRGDPASGDDDVMTLAETGRDGGPRALWVGTRARGLRCFESGVWTVFDTRSSGIPGNRMASLVSDVAADGTHELWVGTDDAGLGRLTLESGVWTVFDASSSELPVDKIHCLLLTEGVRRQLWIGTLGGGLACMTDGLWQRVLTRNSGLPNNLVYSFLETVEPDGHSVYWMGTESGVARYDRGVWTTFGVRDGLPGPVVWSLSQTQGEERAVWAGTADGLARFRDGRWEAFTTQNSGLTTNLVNSIIETSALGGEPETLLATNGAGLCRYDRGRIVPLAALNAKLPSGYILDVAETISRAGRPELWLAMRYGGLARVEGDELEIFDRSNSKISDVGAQCLLATDGGRTLWVGTENGVFRVDLGGDAPRWATTAELSSPAPPDRSVIAIRQDKAGSIYLFTSGGVARLTPSGAGSSPVYDTYLYTFQDGLPSNDCLSGSMVDRAGRVWAATTGGVAFVDPAAATAGRAPEPLYVERATVVGRAEPLRPGEELVYSQNSLEFEFALLSYFKGGETRYRTQLVGFDHQATEWSPASTRAFTNLPAGDYSFVVWARDANGGVSKPTAMTFRVRPAPWATWWAFAFYVVASAGAMYGGVWWRLRAARRRTEELEAVISERTAELAASEARTRRHADELTELVERLKTSEQLALDSEQRAIEASRAKSVFLANMSHELRTPLNAVIGFAQLLGRRPSQSGENRESLAIIERSGEHLLSLINDVLSIAKIEAGKIALVEQPFASHRLLQSVRTITSARAEAKGLDLVFEIDSALPAVVRGDEGKLRQVLINLLGNAVKFTDAGRVTLRARWSDARGGRASFEIEDTGQGVSADEIGRIFEAFVQSESGRASKEGTGLGLVISRQIVRMMEGDIVVQSTPGKGSIFSLEIDLPATDEAPAGEAKRYVTGLARGEAQRRLLVVDDTEENRVLLVNLLTSVGFDVREARDGAEAVERWREWRPNLIWMDMRMPVMGGMEATRRIRNDECRMMNDELKTEPGNDRSTSDIHRSSFLIHHSCKIIALTASAFEHERDAILESGADDLVTKPFQVETIFEKLAEHLGVRFSYATDGSDQREARGGSIAAMDEGDPLTVGRLSRLPTNLIHALHVALTDGDRTAAGFVAEQIRALDEPLGRALLDGIRGFRLHELLSLLETLDTDA